MMQDDDGDDDDNDNDDPMTLNNRAKNHTSERTIVPWTVIFIVNNLVGSVPAPALPTLRRIEIIIVMNTLPL